MKYFANIIWAFLLSWISRSVIHQHVHSPELQQLTYWIFDVPLEMQMIVIWALLSFPKASGQVFSLIMNTLFKGGNYAATGIGQLIEVLWKYRAGKIALGAGIAYLLYYCIY